MSHKITVRVTPEGKVEVSVDGLAGASCKDATKAVERALGCVTEDKPTREFNQTAQASQTLRNNGGAK